MGETITKTQRWLDLIALLLGRKLPLTVDEIMERVPAYAQAYGTGAEKTQASTRRMFERDKDELRAAGIPIEMMRYGINFGAEELEGYRITRNDFYLPYVRLLSGLPPAGPTPPGPTYTGLPTLELPPREAELAVDALRHVADLPGFPFSDDARAALRKLTFDLGPDGRAGDPVLWVDRPGSREVVERLRVFSDALLARKRVSFVYHGIERGEPTKRDVAPYGLFFQRDWYLVGHDATRDAVRVFRVVRTEDVQANARSPKQHDYEIPPDFELQHCLDRSAWELGEESDAVSAEVRFRFPLSLWAARNEQGELVREEPDGSAVRRFQVSQADPFLRLILSLGGDAEIIAPAELSAEYEAMASEVLALYAGGVESNG